MKKYKIADKFKNIEFFFSTRVDGKRVDLTNLGEFHFGKLSQCVRDD